MRCKLYFLFILTFFCSYLPAGAQDTSSTCNAGFIILSNSNNGVLVVSATDTGYRREHYWDFGNGYGSGVFNHIRIAGAAYRRTGTYVIRHIIRDSAAGCYDSSSRSVFVHILQDSCGSPISYSFFADSANRQTIHFIPSPDSVGYAYQWDFGDTTTSFQRTPIHHYSNVPSAYYNVTLTVSRSVGTDTCRSVASMLIFVQGSVPDSGGAPNCSIHFTYTRNPDRTNEVYFHAQDSSGRDSLIWTIMPVSDSLHMVYLTGPSPNYTFPDSGCYIVRLAAIDTLGCQSFDVRQICIDSIPGGGSNLIMSYPNPASDVANIDLKLTRDQPIHINIYNSMGTLVQTKTVAGSGGVNHISLATAGLRKGIYYIELEYGQQIRRTRIQKL